MIEEIGGFFELEINKQYPEFHNAIALNTARNAFEYILLAKNYKKIYIPYYYCDVLLEPLKRNSIQYEFYSINKDLDPKNSFIPEKDDAILYINYFGIKDLTANLLSKMYKNMIIDNSQAFFSNPIPDVDLFYSPRKFFGVPDGSYLYTDQFLNQHFEKDSSYNRVNHLIHRIENGASNAYLEFLENETSLMNQPIKEMSEFTHFVLQSIDYKKAQQKRIENFNYLHHFLSNKNELTSIIEKNMISGALVYPYLIKNDSLKQFLISHKIYIATYWKNVPDSVDKNTFEYYLAQNLIPLPIDHRYGIKEMQLMINLIKKYESCID